MGKWTQVNLALVSWRTKNPLQGNSKKLFKYWNFQLNNFIQCIFSPCPPTPRSSIYGDRVPETFPEPSEVS